VVDSVPVLAGGVARDHRWSAGQGVPLPDYWLAAVSGMLWVAEGQEIFHPLALYGLNAEPKQALPATWWCVAWGLLIGSWLVGVALDWSAGSAMTMLARTAFLWLLLFSIGYLLSAALRRRSQASKVMELYR
jgi:hypothetical protein